MKGIDFTEKNIQAIVRGLKWKTRRLKPTYRLGETLYVRETFWLHAKFDSMTPNEAILAGAVPYFEFTVGCGRQRNKRFMPQAFARYKILIIGVVSENLCDISEGDCIAEGVANKQEFIALFNSLHGEGAFESNPIVWVYGFTHIKH